MSAIILSGLTCLALLVLYLLGRTPNGPPPANYTNACQADHDTWGPCWYTRTGLKCIRCGKERPPPPPGWPYSHRKGPD